MILALKGHWNEYKARSGIMLEITDPSTVCGAGPACRDSLAELDEH